MDITSWTSDGMNWSNPDPSQKKYWDALNLAYFERLAACSALHSTAAGVGGGGSVLSYNKPYLSTLGASQESAYLSSGYYFNAEWILSSMSVIYNGAFKKFVNYKKYDGDYSTLTDFNLMAPVWTRDDILSYACDGEYISLTSLGGYGISGERAVRYLKQCYRLLNLLRWRRGFPNKLTAGASGFTRYGAAENADGTSYALALSQFHGSERTPFSTLAPPLNTSFGNDGNGWDVEPSVGRSYPRIASTTYFRIDARVGPPYRLGYDIVEYALELGSIFMVNGTYLMADNFVKQIDIWASPVVVGGQYGITQPTLAGCPLPLSLTNCAKIGTHTVPSIIPAPYVSFGWYNRCDVAPPPPTVTAVPGSQRSAVSGWESVLEFVCKYDVPGGFNFIADV